MPCKNCGAETTRKVIVCLACPRAELHPILPRLLPNPDAASWLADEALQWRDPSTGMDYYALDCDGDLIVAGGLQECTVALIEVRR